MFICFEGIDGAGKSTQARALVQRLKDHYENGLDVELVADPGTTRIGTAIRQILLHNDEPISTAAQMLLFSAARAELAEYIKHRLQAGAIIVCDRWLLSTFVYQGEINNISLDLISAIFAETSEVLPDFCFLLDLPAELSHGRIQRPGDRYEKRSLEDRQRMRAAYIRHAHERPHAKNVCTIDANRSFGEIHELVYDCVRERISQKLTGGQLHGSDAKLFEAKAAT